MFPETISYDLHRHKSNILKETFIPSCVVWDDDLPDLSVYNSFEGGITTVDKKAELQTELGLYVKYEHAVLEKLWFWNSNHKPH